MKTNQIMLRDNCIEQRTIDNFFNATMTIKNWNRNNIDSSKSIGEYQKIKSTVDFIKHLQENEGIEKPYLSSNKGTWMHPLLYVDFCMWISIEFKTMALKYVLDGLIKTRHSAGDYYNQMCAVIMEKYISNNNCKPSPFVYIKEANMINDIASIGVNRNEMNEKQLEKITILQKINSTLILDNVGIDSRKKHLQIVARSL